jgi:hypothetical protein
MQPISVQTVRKRTCTGLLKNQSLQGRGLKITYYIIPDRIPSLGNLTHTAIRSVKLSFKHVDCCIAISMVHRKTKIFNELINHALDGDEMLVFVHTHIHSISLDRSGPNHHRLSTGEPSADEKAISESQW